MSVCPYILLESVIHDCENKASYVFIQPKTILTFFGGENIVDFWKKLQAYHCQGYWLAGYFTYEFGYWLDEVFSKQREKFSFPLAWIMVCKKPAAISNQNFDSGIFKLKNVRPNINSARYFKAVNTIKNYLRQGQTYQVNYTFRLNFDFNGSAFGLYEILKLRQKTSYSAFINTGVRQIISLSPELFFRSDGIRIISRPMKGTAVPGKESELIVSAKNKAENLMIVDLLRNDISRIAENVRVPKIFQIQRYRTVSQMTSDITGTLRRDLCLRDIFNALFPCGSVTGAPKIKTMGFIRELEKSPRNIYTGTIGYISPDFKMCFNVAIRTLTIENNHDGSMGIGGGIVYDSKPKDEYREALLKARFLTQILR